MKITKWISFIYNLLLPHHHEHHYHIDKSMEKIDLRAILRAKNPTLNRWIPGFVVRFIGWILCLRKVNYVIENYSHQEPLEFIDSTLRYIGVQYRVFGAENLKGVNRVLFAANHPLGGLDGMVLARALSTEGRQVKLVVNDVLMYIKPLEKIFIPINKYGNQSTSYAKSFNQSFESDDSIIFFPAGLCSRLVDGKVCDLDWKKSFLLKAVQSNRAIVPVYVSGRNSMMFYRLAQWRAAVGIRFNIELILLPYEMFRQKNQIIDIHIGKAVTVDEQCESVEMQVELIRQKVYDMDVANPVLNS